LTPFAFIIHPITPKDAARKYPIARMFPDGVIEAILAKKKPMVVSEVDGIVSKTGATTHGWFVACPLTPRLMTDKLPLEAVYERISQAVEIAHQAGAKIVGLGAFTSVVGDGGVTVAERAQIAVTTGNSYTVATAIEGTVEACRRIGVEPSNAKLAVVGATGSIGKTCAIMLADRFESTILIGRDLERTQAIADLLPRTTAHTDIDCIRDADAIISVTSNDSSVIEPEHLKPGCVVCDVARPRDVSVRVAKKRSDVLVIEGGVVAIPGDVNFHLNFGFPPKTAYACMSETILLALENRVENYTLGKNVSVEQVKETLGFADKHGFKLAGFRSFEKAVTDEMIEQVRIARLRSS
jgi:predicted amino acid dehydrogenase